MTRVLVWKELREQWVIWLALALVAAGGVAGVFALLPTGPGRDGMLTTILWLTAWGYGMVCGALLFASEAEGATQVFLDTLPGSRWRLWRVKASTGLALLVAQLAALALVGFVLYWQRYARPQAGVDVTGLLLCGGIGYAWGLYCGSSAVHVLGAVGRAALLQAAAAVVVYVLVSAVLLLYPSTLPFAQHGAIFLEVMALLAAGVAARSRTVYCRTDRLRADALSPDEATRVYWGELLSQAWREARWFALGMGLYGLAGMAALVFLGAASWPVLTLVLGVACGVTASRGTEPAVGRGLLARAGVRFAIGLGAAGIITLVVIGPSLLRSELETSGIRNVFRDRVPVSAVSALATNPGLFLTLWLVEGFAGGLLSGLLFRSRVLAAAAGFAVSTLFVAIWLPTVITGGNLHAWHLLAVPAVFLAATFLLDRSRAAGRLTTGRVVVVTGGALVAAGLSTAAALCYRAYEMPLVPDAIDVDAFVASLPGPGENSGGQRMADALQRLFFIEQTFVRTEPLAGLVPGQRRPDRKGSAEFRRDSDQVLAELAEAANLPPGIVADPRETTFLSPLVQVTTGPLAAALLTERGRERQVAGDPAAFADNLRTGLAVARNLRHGSGTNGAFFSVAVERIMSLGVERWLERLDGRPDLLRRAHEALQHHLDAPPADLGEMRKTDFLVRLNSFTDPDNVPRNGNGADPFFGVAPDDKPLLRFAWAAPWEKIRLRRVLDGLESDDPRLRQLARRLMPPVVGSLTPSENLAERLAANWPRPRELFLCRVAALQVALRLYQAEEGRPAEKLDELVPKYLRAIPADPYDGQPFRYRLSKGETLDWPPDGYMFGFGPPPEPRKVPAGQGILWSVGEDRQDGGGRVQEWGHPSSVVRGPEDRLALVPFPPNKP